MYVFKFYLKLDKTLKKYIFKIINMQYLVIWIEFLIGHFNNKINLDVLSSMLLNSIITNRKIKMCV